MNPEFLAMSDFKNSVITNLEPNFLVEDYSYSFIYAESDRARHTAQYKIHYIVFV